MAAPSLRLLLLPDAYAVARLQADAPFPEWAQGGAFSSVTRTSDELSVIALASRVPAEVSQEAGFRCLKVQGPLAFSEVGVLASLAAPLAKSGISLLAVATFDTDYLLVPEADLERAIGALREAGHDVIISRRFGDA